MRNKTFDVPSSYNVTGNSIYSKLVDKCFVSKTFKTRCSKLKRKTRRPNVTTRRCKLW